MGVLLRQGDINPDKPDNNRRTPLWFTAKDMHWKVMDMLLGQSEVIPNKSDIFGQIYLFCATRNGHTGVIARRQPQASATSGMV